jgi:integrase
VQPRQPRTSDFILNQRNGKPWTEDGFRSSWKKAVSRAGIEGRTFHDLRGTFVTRLAIAKCTEAQIASITGHSINDVKSILDVHYLHRDPQLARDAMANLEKSRKHKKLPTERPTGLIRTAASTGKVE